MAASVDNALFEQLLASCQKDYEEAEAGSRWIPPVGSYQCELEPFKTGTADDNGAKYLYLVPVYKISDGLDFVGKTFEGGFFSNRDAKALGRMKGLLEKLLGDAATGILLEDVRAAIAMAGVNPVQVSVKESKQVNKKTGKPFVNVFLDEVFAPTA